MALLCYSLAHLHITQIVDSQSSSRNRRSSLPSHSAHICIHSSNSGGCASRVCCNSLGNGINGLKDGMDLTRIRVLHSPPRLPKNTPDAAVELDSLKSVHRVVVADEIGFVVSF
jgi:hypothetical protein